MTSPELMVGTDHRDGWSELLRGPRETVRWSLNLNTIELLRLLSRISGDDYLSAAVGKLLAKALVHDEKRRLDGCSLPDRVVSRDDRRTRVYRFHLPSSLVYELDRIAKSRGWETVALVEWLCSQYLAVFSGRVLGELISPLIVLEQANPRT